MLDKEQQNLIEKSMWVVDVALAKQNMQDDEDMRQEALLYLCKCLERFDKSKGVKWTTYAFKSVYLFLKKRKLSDNARKRREICCDSLPEPKNGDLMYSEINNTENIVETVCTPLERLILDLREKGYKCAEIGAIIKLSVKDIYKCSKRIKEKINAACETLDMPPLLNEKVL